MTLGTKLFMLRQKKSISLEKLAIELDTKPLPSYLK